MTSDPPDGPAATRLCYLVGVDGSEPSVQALAAALDLARARGADVRAVSMWHFPPLSVERPTLARRLHQQAEERLEEVVAEARSRVSAGDVTVTTEVYQYPAADRLIDLSAEVDLVVIGRRSRRGLAALGSVSERVASHAHCPVLIIPPR